MHGNARLTPLGRLTLVMRVEAGRPVAHVAAEMGISRPTAYKWWRRWQEGGVANLVDRSSRPRHCPHQTSELVAAQIGELRTTLKLGPVRIGARLGVPASTVHKVLVRLGMNRLAWIDRPTGQVIRRIETHHPGELVHIDIKKLGRIPDGGGWKVLGREAGIKNNSGHGPKRVGYGFVHSAIDGHSRLAYTEVLSDEQAVTAVAFWQRAHTFFANHNINVEAVLTDNGPCYRSYRFAEALGAIKHRRTRPRRPQTNGKVERFNRTLLDEWAYVRPYQSEAERIAALDDWLHLYNHHRHHTAIGGPPVSRVNDLPGHYS